MSATIDAVFNHVEGAIKSLEAGDSEKALRLLKPIYGDLAAIALRTTNADAGSPHYHKLLRVVAKGFPIDPEDEWMIEG